MSTYEAAYKSLLQGVSQQLPEEEKMQELCLVVFQEVGNVYLLMVVHTSLM